MGFNLILVHNVLTLDEELINSLWHISITNSKNDVLDWMAIYNLIQKYTISTGSKSHHILFLSIINKWLQDEQMITWQSFHSKKKEIFWKYFKNYRIKTKLWLMLMYTLLIFCSLITDLLNHSFSFISVISLEEGVSKNQIVCL